MRVERVVFLAASLAVAPCMTARAQPPRVEASVARDLLYGRGAGTPHHDAPGTAEVVIELHRPDDLSRLLALEGVDVARSRSGPIAYGGFVAARIDTVGLASLRAAGFVDRVRTTPPSGLPPLDRSGARLGLPYVRGMTRDGMTGEGVLIADLDTPIDIFHPAFFQADAGYHDWIDQNGDGHFGAGDAIDANDDGVAQPEEAASILSANPVDFGGSSPAAIRPRRGFDPGIDWLYFDLDGDGRRSVGMEAGYDDTAAGLGEPMFVPDDVDRDGVLDRAERVVQLGSSKVRAARVDTSSGRTFEYTRGTNLSEMLRDYTGGAHGYADTLHGSGVVGILVADVPLIGRRWVGIAPDADVVVASDFSNSNFDELMWALNQSPDVMVHEYVLWTTVALDGSDPTSALIDSSTAEGVAHACPAGNIGGGRRHAMSMLAPDSVASFGVDVTTTYLELTVNVPVGTDPTVALVEPDGTSHPFTVPFDNLADGTELYRREADGVRTFRSLTFVAYRAAGLAAGTWHMEVRSGPGEPYPVHVYVYDEAGFNGGSTMLDATDVSTLAWPSTADDCIAVGAFPSHTADEGTWFRGFEAEGEVRDYSARGPRLDGARTIGVVAPDNPWSVLGAGDVFPSMPGAVVAPEGSYQVFGGTSGAGPHVAGTLALLAQSGTHGADATARILATASRDAVTGATDNDDYGHGRLDAAAALGVARMGEEPSLRLTLTEDGGALRVSLTSADPEGGAVTARWDLTYDGTWDTELGSLDARTVPLPAHLKVEVRDEDGRRNQAVVRVDSLDELHGLSDAGTPDGGVLEAGDGGPGGGGGGCGCHASGRSRGGALGLGLMALALLLRRRARGD